MNSIPRLINLDVSSITEKISSAKKIILSTHKQSDGDGLGAQLALFHALRKIGKDVRVLCVDEVPSKYRYLNTNQHIEVFEGPHSPIEKSDLALIFDTNDSRLVEPLYSTLVEKCREVLFIDHHPLLNQGPTPPSGSFIETKAASTGEIVYFIIKALGIRFDEAIALALYTSIAFDTQVFRYVKGAPTSHLICAELLQYVRKPEEVHRHLFATHTRGKIALLAKVLSEIEYFYDGKIATLKLNAQDLTINNLEMDDSRDIIDMIMNINSVDAAALFRQENGGYKMSLRSKGSIEVLGVAETLGGGGHMYASGAFITGDYQQLKKDVVQQLSQRLDSVPLDSSHATKEKE